MATARKRAAKKAKPFTGRVEVDPGASTTISHCHFENGTMHVSHDEHTVKAAEAVARAITANAAAAEGVGYAIRTNADALFAIAQIIASPTNYRPLGPILSIGDTSPRDQQSE